MAGQNRIADLQRLQYGQQVEGEVVPRDAGVQREGRQARPAMAALVERQDPEAREGRQDGRVGAGVEAVGVGEDDIDGTVARAEFKTLRVPAPARRGDTAGFPRDPGVHQALVSCTQVL